MDLRLVLYTLPTPPLAPHQQITARALNTERGPGLRVSGKSI